MIDRGKGKDGGEQRGRPTASPQTWQTLLAAALRVVDSLPAAGYGELAFRMGGGTVLAFAFGHRISNGIDLFIDDAQALGSLTPRLNDTSAGLTDDYQEAANALKLVLPDGDIDFILAGPVTGEPAKAHLDFGGRAIPLEPAAEILAKKLLYRAASFSRATSSISPSRSSKLRRPPRRPSPRPDASIRSCFGA